MGHTARSTRLVCGERGRERGGWGGAGKRKTIIIIYYSKKCDTFCVCEPLSCCQWAQCVCMCVCVGVYVCSCVCVCASKCCQLLQSGKRKRNETVAGIAINHLCSSLALTHPDTHTHTRTHAHSLMPHKCTHTQRSDAVYKVA